MQPNSVAPVSPLASQETRSCCEREILDEIERQVGPRNFEHCFRGKATLTLDGDEAVLGVGSDFLLAWMQKHFRGQITDAARKFLGPNIRLRFEVDPRVALQPVQVAHRPAPDAQLPKRSSDGSQPVANASASPETPSLETPTIGDAPANGEVSADLAHSPPPRPPGRRDKAELSGSRPVAGRRFADLADFVAGPCNELALLAARQVCETPGEKFNPLYVHGNAGLGKTHLLEGVYRLIRPRPPT